MMPSMLLHNGLALIQQRCSCGVQAPASPSLNHRAKIRLPAIAPCVTILLAGFDSFISEHLTFRIAIAQSHHRAIIWACSVVLSDDKDVIKLSRNGDIFMFFAVGEAELLIFGQNAATIPTFLDVNYTGLNLWPKKALSNFQAR